MMKKILSLKHIIFVIFLFLIGFLVFSYQNSKNNKKLSQQTIYPISENDKGWSSFGNFTPGVSTEQDLTKTAGEPVKVDNNGESKVLEYRGSNTNWNNKIYINSEQKIAFIKRVVSTIDRISEKEITSQLGSPEIKLFGPYAEVGFILYVYPQKGFAYLGSKTGDTVLELWYFDPTITIDNLIKQYAPEYEKEDKPRSQLIDKAPDNN
jgi:hypothetical protein